MSSAAGRRRRKRASRTIVISQIIEALEKLGGTAHRDVVVDQIARDRMLLNPAEIEILRLQVAEVFEAHSECVEEAAPLFSRVYGPNSRRWGFSRFMQERLRRGESVDLEQLAV